MNRIFADEQGSCSADYYAGYKQGRLHGEKRAGKLLEFTFYVAFVLGVLLAFAALVFATL